MRILHNKNLDGHPQHWKSSHFRFFYNEEPCLLWQCKSKTRYSILENVIRHVNPFNSLSHTSLQRTCSYVKTRQWPLELVTYVRTQLPTFRSNLPQRECPRSADSQTTKWTTTSMVIPLIRSQLLDMVLSQVHPLSILKTYIATTWTQTD